MGVLESPDVTLSHVSTPSFKSAEGTVFSPYDPSFVLPAEHRPISRHTDWIAADEIPTIDLTALREAAGSTEKSRQEISRKVSGEE